MAFYTEKLYGEVRFGQTRIMKNYTEFLEKNLDECFKVD
jgi:hypothetical protein